MTLASAPVRGAAPSRRAARPAINVSGVHKAYGPRGSHVLALQDITLEVERGEFVCLVGASGCGKSTLLTLLAGLERAQAGTVETHGRLSLLFQDAALFPWLTAAQNVELALRLAGAPRATRAPRAAALLELVHLHGFADRRPHELSGGMRQRTALARALAQDAEILLMDEPFGALDAQTRTLLQADLERIWEADQKTVVFVTHAMDEAVFLSDRVVIMSPRPGRIHEIVEVDLPRPRGEEVRKDPRFVELTSYVWDVLRGMIVRAPEDSW